MRVTFISVSRIRGNLRVWDIILLVERMRHSHYDMHSFHELWSESDSCFMYRTHMPRFRLMIERRKTLHYDSLVSHLETENRDKNRKCCDLNPELPVCSDVVNLQSCGLMICKRKANGNGESKWDITKKRGRENAWRIYSNTEETTVGRTGEVGQEIIRRNVRVKFGGVWSKRGRISVMCLLFHYRCKGSSDGVLERLFTPLSGPFKGRWVS